MKVLLSYSGSQSQGVSEALRTLIGQVLHDMFPWAAFKDIGPGSRWQEELHDRKLTRHWNEFNNKITGDWISWDAYWEKQNRVVQALNSALHGGVYEPTILMGISNGGLHFADTALRRIYDNAKPLLALYANRHYPNGYFNNPLNNSLFEGNFFKKIIGERHPPKRKIEILMLDDVVGTTTTFLQLINYLDIKLPEIKKDCCVRFIFLLTPWGFAAPGVR